MRRTLTSLALAAGLAVIPGAALAQEDTAYPPSEPPIDQELPECEEANGGTNGAEACEPGTEDVASGALPATGVDAAWLAVAGGALAATGAGGVLAARRRRTR